LPARSRRVCRDKQRRSNHSRNPSRGSKERTARSRWVRRSSHHHSIRDQFFLGLFGKTVRSRPGSIGRTTRSKRVRRSGHHRFNRGHLCHRRRHPRRQQHITKGLFEVLCWENDIRREPLLPPALMLGAAAGGPKRQGRGGKRRRRRESHSCERPLQPWGWPPGLEWTLTSGCR
jgi:hypothetical protein